MSLKIINRVISGWGSTYGPPGDGPFPAVMVLHGSEGAWSGHSSVTAAVLACHGFLAFPFGYSKGGNMWNAGSIEDVPLDRTVDALSALRSMPVSGKIGIYGVSRGAEHALLVASLMARDGIPNPPAAIAVHAAPDVICGAFIGATWRDEGDPGWQVWDPGKRAWTWRGSSEDLRPTTPIEIERYDGALFLSHGVKDSIWSVSMTQRLEDRLRRHGRHPEVHYLADQDHVPRGEAENAHHAALMAFLTRALTADPS